MRYQQRALHHLIVRALKRNTFTADEPITVVLRGNTVLLQGTVSDPDLIPEADDLLIRPGRAGGQRHLQRYSEGQQTAVPFVSAATGPASPRRFRAARPLALLGRRACAAPGRSDSR